MSRLPDFYVVGAPKCGTTSLHRYLRQHPGVFVPDVKEPNFFCSDFPSIQKYKSLEDYSTLFEPAQENQLVGEASPWYLYSKTAIQNILDVQPDAKFIVMLRNPVDAVISYYRYMRYYLVEDRNAILDAVLLEDWGGKAKTLIRHRHANPYLKYRGIFSYAEQVERIQKLVPKENLLILFFEDFFSSPAKNFGQVLNFLGLPEWPIKIEAHNTAIEWRFDFLRKILVNQGPLMQRGIARISRFFRSRGININKIFLQGVTKKGNAAKIDDVTKEMLKGIFADDVKDLFSCLTPPSHKKWEYTNSIDFKPQLIEARRRLLMREIPKSTGIGWAN